MKSQKEGRDMSIISLEELENELLDQKEEITLSHPEMLEEKYESVERVIDSVINLDSLIEQHNEALKAIEENKQSISEIQQMLQDSMVSTNHILSVIAKSPLKKVAELKKQSITFESINNNPIDTLSSFNNMLIDIRCSISEEGFKEVASDLAESFGRIFTSYKSDYKLFQKRSGEVIKVLKKYKSELRLLSPFELSPKDSVYASPNVVDIAKNFEEFVTKYGEAMSRGKTGLVNFNLRAIRSLKGIKAKESNRYPLGLVPTVEHEGGLNLRCISPDAIKIITQAFNPNQEIKKQKIDFEEIRILSNRIKINSVDNLIQRIVLIDKMMGEHFAIIEKPLSTFLMKGRKFASIAGGLLAFGASWVISGWAGKKTTELLLKNASKKVKFFGSLAGGTAGDMAFTQTLSLIPVNKINKNLYSLAKNNYVWEEMFNIQKGLVSRIQILDDDVRLAFEDELKVAFKVK